MPINDLSVLPVFAGVEFDAAGIKATLVLEDADPALQPLSCIDAYGSEHELANRIRQDFRAIVSSLEADISFGRDLPRMFRNAGMADLSAEAHFPVVMPECIPLEIATIRMIRDDLLTNGIAAEREIEQRLSLNHA